MNSKGGDGRSKKDGEGEKRGGDRRGLIFGKGQNSYGHFSGYGAGLTPPSSWQRCCCQVTTIFAMKLLMITANTKQTGVTGHYETRQAVVYKLSVVTR